MTDVADTPVTRGTVDEWKHAWKQAIQQRDQWHADFERALAILKEQRDAFHLDMAWMLNAIGSDAWYQKGLGRNPHHDRRMAANKAACGLLKEAGYDR